MRKLKMTARAIKLREGRAHRDRILSYFEKMQVCYKMLSEEERRALHEWDRNRPAGVGTSDWPGWARYIGISPLDETKRPFSPKLVM